MKIEEFIHRGVRKDGTVKGGGAVHTDARVIIIRGSCGLGNCHCSDGYSLTLGLPLKNGIVRGLKVKFDNKAEMKKILGKN